MFKSNANYFWVCYMVLLYLLTKANTTLQTNAIYCWKTETWKSLVFLTHITHNIYFNLNTKNRIVVLILFQIMANIWKFRYLTKKNNYELIFSQNWRTTLTYFRITPPINNTLYLFQIRFYFYFTASGSLQLVFWSNNDHFMHDLSSTSHFKKNYATGIPEGYIIGGTARPYSEMRKIETAGIHFYWDLSYSHRQIQWCYGMPNLKKHNTATQSLENQA